jgi:hypothetical protein
MANYKLYEVFETMNAMSIDDLDIGPLCVYMVDLVNESALPYLTQQFGVDGFKGEALTSSVEEKRELVKKAISIKKRLGTSYAIKAALASVGFSNVAVNEQVGAVYDGTYKYDGTIKYSSGSWVYFGVKIYVPDPDAITDDQITLINKLILENKRAISVLIYVTFETI